VWVDGWVVYQVAKTYGKVFHFWQFDKGDTLPLGLPQLMMSFTDYGQLNPELASGTIFHIKMSLVTRRLCKHPVYVDLIIVWM
jgi:hypothetical protein